MKCFTSGDIEEKLGEFYKFCEENNLDGDNIINSDEELDDKMTIFNEVMAGGLPEEKVFTHEFCYSFCNALDNKMSNINK